MNPKYFYDDLWKIKKQEGYRQFYPRDWFHRYILDPIFNPYANSRFEIALSLLKSNEKGAKRLLDIGCWNGCLLELIQKTELYDELYGVDIVLEGVNTAKSKGFRAQVLDLNSDLFPFPDEFFNGITMLAVLEHIFDPFLTIQEIYRVLSPGGYFIIDVPNVASFTNRFRILTGRLPVTSLDPGWDGGHLHYFTKHALDRFLINHGFKILARKTSGGGAQLREHWLSLLSGELIYLCQRV